MALELLDGSNADIDFEIDSVSFKCHSSSMAVQFIRNIVTRPPTFCASNWRTALNGMKFINWALNGFLAMGDDASKLGQYHLTDTYPAITATFATNCAVDFTGVVETDSGGTQAADLATRALTGTSHNDDAAVAWVVA